MDRFEKIGYLCLGVVAVAYVAAMAYASVAALPWGAFGLVLIVGFGVLLVKVLRERLANREDDHYSRHVEK